MPRPPGVRGKAGASGTSPWLAGLLGAAIALTVAVVAFVIVTRGARRTSPTAASPTSQPQPKEPAVT